MKCNECFYYKEKNKTIGMCNLRVKLMPATQRCEDFKPKNVIIENNKQVTKIVIKNGKKHYEYK